MPQNIFVPGVGNLQFPDGMNDDAMKEAIYKNFPNTQPPLMTRAGDAIGNAASTVVNALPQVAQGVQQNWNKNTNLSGLSDVAGIPEAAWSQVKQGAVALPAVGWATGQALNAGTQALGAAITGNADQAPNPIQVFKDAYGDASEAINNVQLPGGQTIGQLTQPASQVGQRVNQQMNQVQQVLPNAVGNFVQQHTGSQNLGDLAQGAAMLGQNLLMGKAAGSLAGGLAADHAFANEPNGTRTFEGDWRPGASPSGSGGPIPNTPNAPAPFNPNNFDPAFAGRQAVDADVTGSGPYTPTVNQIGNQVLALRSPVKGLPNFQQNPAGDGPIISGPAQPPITQGNQIDLMKSGTASQLNVSPMGQQMIAKLEGGMKPTAYDDGYGNMTIGIGHMLPKAYDPSKPVPQATLDKWFQQDLTNAQNLVRKAINPNVQLSQPQFDALTSLAFNLKNKSFVNSDVVKFVNQGDFQAAANAFANLNHANGQVSNGLTDRRKAEAQLFSQSPAGGNTFDPTGFHATGLGLQDAQGNPVQAQPAQGVDINQLINEQWPNQSAMSITDDGMQPGPQNLEAANRAKSLTDMLQQPIEGTNQTLADALFPQNAHEIVQAATKNPNASLVDIINANTNLNRAQGLQGAAAKAKQSMYDKLGNEKVPYTDKTMAEMLFPDEPQQPKIAGLLPHKELDPYVSMPDGSVARASQIQGLMQNGTPEQRAQLLGYAAQSVTPKPDAEKIVGGAIKQQTIPLQQFIDKQFPQAQPASKQKRAGYEKAMGKALDEPIEGTGQTVGDVVFPKTVNNLATQNAVAAMAKRAHEAGRPDLAEKWLKALDTDVIEHDRIKGFERLASNAEKKAQLDKGTTSKHSKMYDTAVRDMERGDTGLIDLLNRLDEPNKKPAPKPQRITGKRGINTVDPERDSIALAATKIGGLKLKELGGDLTHANGKPVKLPETLGGNGVAFLAHNGTMAKSPDKMRENLAELNYLPHDSTIDDMVSRINEELQDGEPKHFALAYNNQAEVDHHYQQQQEIADEKRQLETMTVDQALADPEFKAGFLDLDGLDLDAENDPEAQAFMEMSADEALADPNFKAGFIAEDNRNANITGTQHSQQAVSNEEQPGQAPSQPTSASAESGSARTAVPASSAGQQSGEAGSTDARLLSGHGESSQQERPVKERDGHSPGRINQSIPVAGEQSVGELAPDNDSPFLKRCTAVSVNAIFEHFGIEPIKAQDVPIHGTGVLDLLHRNDLDTVLFDSPYFESWSNKTVAQFIKTKPQGVFYMFSAGHAMALVNGRLIDTAGGTEEKNRKKLLGVFKVTPKTQGLTLTQPTEESLKLKEQELALKKQELDLKERELELKQKADQQRDDFTLTGSDRPADANPNQKDFTEEDWLRERTKDGPTEFHFAGMPSTKQIAQAFRKAFNVRNTDSLSAVQTADAMARAFWYSPVGSIGDIETPTARTLRNMIFSPVTRSASDNALPPDLISRTNYKIGKYGKMLEDALEHLKPTGTAGALLRMGYKLTKAQNLELFRHLENGTNSQALRYTLQGIRDLLKEIHTDMKSAGLDVGEIENYFPHVFDGEKIEKDMPGFVADLIANGYKPSMAQNIANRIVDGEGVADWRNQPARVTTDWEYWKKKVMPDGSVVWAEAREPEPFTPERAGGEKGGASKNSWERARKLELPTDVLEKWLKTDVEAVLARYIRKSVERMEYARMFGKSEMKLTNMVMKILEENKAKPFKEQLPAQEILDRIYGLADALQHKFKPIQNRGAARFNRSLANYEIMLHMGFVALASVSEIAAPAVHHGLFVGAYLKGLGAAFHEGARAVDRLLLNGKLSQSILGELPIVDTLKELGMIKTHAMQAENRFYGEVGKNTQRFMRFTLLENLTDIQRIITHDSIQRVIRRNAKALAKGGLRAAKERMYRKQLIEYGIKPEDAIAWYRGGMRDAAFNEKADYASVRWIHRTITEPNAATKPLHMSDPHLRQTNLFRTFSAAFNNVFLKKMASDLVSRDITLGRKAGIIGGIVAMMALAFFSLYLRQKINGTWDDTKSVARMVLETADRAGFTAQASNAVNVASPYKNGLPDIASRTAGVVLGPAFGDATRVATAFAKGLKSDDYSDFQRELVKSVPVVNNFVPAKSNQ